MKSKRIQPTTQSLRVLTCGLALSLLGAYQARAHPYASGITNNNGTISFILNETADTVGVYFPDNGTTNFLGNNLAPGVYSFALAPGLNRYEITVSKVGNGKPSQISPTPAAGQSSTNLDFFGPRGVAVNRNPKGHNFGRIYVSNASANTNLRPVGRGLYVLNANFSDCLGYKNAASPPQANFPAGGSQWWGGSTTYGPYRLWVGVDDTVYAADCSGNGNTAGEPVWMIDPDLITPIKMFNYIGTSGGNSGNAGPCQSTPVVTGSLATGDLTLTCLMWNYAASGSGYQTLLQYNIGSGPIDSSTVWSASPKLLVNNTQPGFGNGGANGVTADVAANPTNSFFYVVFNRSNSGGITNGNNQVWVFDGSTNTVNQSSANPQCVWSSSGLASKGQNGVGLISGGAVQDYFQSKGIQPGAVAISPDGQYMALANNLSANFYLLKLTNGIPDISTLTTNTAPAIINRSLTFDLANNLYTVEGNSDSLRCYSLGLTTTCITANDASAANGTFTMLTPATTASVVASQPTASQDGTKGKFTISRTGDNTVALAVTYTLTGTATNGFQYSTLPLSATIPGGQTSVDVLVSPIASPVAGPTRTVVMSLTASGSYTVAAPASATVIIQDNHTPSIQIAVKDTQFYERTNDLARFTLTRWGNTNVSVPAVTITYRGTAAAGTQFYGPATVDIPAGTVTKTFAISPIHDGVVTGPLTVTATVAPAGDSTYTVGSPSTSDSITRVDSDDPPETVLWADNLQTDTSANWTQLFAAAPDPTYDATVDWAYDYAANLAAPPAPHSGSDTHGLHMTVNKNDTIAASAALNLYPKGQSFSGNYAFRFDMFLVQNDTTGTTEYALFGINHSGTKTNWFRNSTTTFAGVDANGWSFDGIFFDVESDGANLGQYVGYSSPTTANRNPTPINGGVTAEAMQSVFKAPPWTVGAGSGGAPANLYGSTTPIWADVEIKQVDGIIYWSINHSLIFAYTNTTGYTSGNIMLGYEDGYDPRGSNGGSVVYANARVVGLARPVITQIRQVGGNVEITFSANAGDVAGQFALQSATALNGSFADTSATLSSLGGGLFKAVKAVGGGTQQFYRVKRL